VKKLFGNDLVGRYSYVSLTTNLQWLLVEQKRKVIVVVGSDPLRLGR